MSRRVFLRARWRWLAMFNYAADPRVLEGRVPRGTEIDTFDGTCFLSVVGFRFADTRVLGLPIPFHRHFDEVNLRFYVRRKAPEGWRRGVVFVKELVPRRAIAWVARTVYGENYHAVPMRHDVRPPQAQVPGRVAYEWRVAGRWHGLEATLEGEARPAAEGGEAAFITEHYWGYAGGAGRPTTEYEVRHPRWNLWHPPASRLTLDAESVYGADFAGALRGDPTSVFVADGSEVTVHRGTRLED